MSTVDALHCAFARRRSRAGARDCSAPGWTLAPRGATTLGSGDGWCPAFMFWGTGSPQRLLAGWS